MVKVLFLLLRILFLFLVESCQTLKTFRVQLENFFPGKDAYTVV
jgi:hypothetical protein